MDGNSLNITRDLLEKLREIIPQAFTEEKLDVQKLQTLLGEAVNTDHERYQLSWAGKSEAYKVLQMPTTATLIPQPEQSVNWEASENIFIEGENLEVLKVLQKSYYGKIKMIYIDPPYNTGSDSFIYPDKFSETKEEYLKRIGEKDEEGYMMKEGLFRKNSKENGQFHSNWLNMMLPRLFLARNLLKEDGVIFVSIDDNEQANLKLLMDEVFGEENFIANIIWQRTFAAKNDSKFFSSEHESLLVYSKNIYNFSLKLLGRTDKQNDRYLNPDNDPRGVWTSTDLLRMEHRENSVYEITGPTGKVWKPEPGTSWRHPEDEILQMIEKNEIYWGVDGTAKPRRKRFLADVKQGIVAQTIWKHDEVGHTQEAKQHLIKLFGGERTFDTPKPIRLIKRMMTLTTSAKEGDLILDFFSGSNTTAHAVYEMNEEDGGNRKFICIQLPEITDSESDAFKIGYKTISEIGQNRIVKAIEKIQATRNGKIEFSEKQILGFRKYTLAPSNFKIWRGDIIANEEDLKKQMTLFVTPQKADAQTENILWELLIKNGVQLSEKIHRIAAGEGANIYHTSDQRFAFVLDKYTPEVQEKVLSLRPRTVICLDSLFQGQDMVKTNAQLKMEDNGITFKTV